LIFLKIISNIFRPFFHKILFWRYANSFSKYPLEMEWAQSCLPRQIAKSKLYLRVIDHLTGIDDSLEKGFVFGHVLWAASFAGSVASSFSFLPGLKEDHIFPCWQSGFAGWAAINSRRSYGINKYVSRLFIPLDQHPPTGIFKTYRRFYPGFHSSVIPQFLPSAMMIRSKIPTP
jgi:hypothetical protein